MPRMQFRKRFHIPAVAVVAGLALVALPVPAQAGPAPGIDRPVKPADQPERGLVYRGLEPTATGACAGLFRITGTATCTHGPDAAPLNVDVRRSISPDPRAGETAKVVCDGDGRSGNRVQVLYVHGTLDRYAEFVDTFRAIAAGTDVIYQASAAKTGGKRNIRYVTDAACAVSVLNVKIDDSALADFGTQIQALTTLGFNRADRKYMLFTEATVYCGIGNIDGDDRPIAENANNFGPRYGRSDAGCWSAHVAGHELGHNLGAVQLSAPHTSGGWHCYDTNDLMCYKDSPTAPDEQLLCPGEPDRDLLDCNNDDYFHTDPAAGSYLATRWNVANNTFLIRPAGSAPGAPRNLRASVVASMGAVLTWDRPASGTVTAYDVYQDGTYLGSTSDRTFGVTGLQWSTAYPFTVRTRDRFARVSPAASRTVTTAPPNPNSPPGVCGASYVVTDWASLAVTGGVQVGRVYLLFDSASGNKCTVTIKDTSVGTASAASAFLEVQGRPRDTVSGDVTYYAGPVRAVAAGACVRWGGSVGSASFTSEFGNCV